MSMRLDERIQLFEYKLNETDDQIVAHLRQHKAEVVTLSIQRLAAQLFTVPNTITRLAHKLGYDGFAQLKNSLKEELALEQAQDARSPYYGLYKTIQLIDMERIATVARLIQKAKRVLFLGVGDSAPLCEMIVKNLRVARREVEFYVHHHEIEQEIGLLTPDDLLFVVSLSGETPLVVEMARLAKERAVPLVSLTHLYRNSLAQMADYHLYCYSPQRRINQYNVTDRVPVMIVLRTLSESYWQSCGLGV